MSGSPPRVAVVRSPAWPLTAAVLDGRAGRGPIVDPTRPLALVVARRVQCCSPIAWRHGVRPGQRQRQAQGACPELVLVPPDPDRDARHFEPVVRSIGTLVPLVDVESPGCVSLLTRGPSRYVGGDERLAHRLAALVAVDTDAASAGGVCGVGIADGRLAATLAARHAAREGRPVVVPPGHEATAAFLGPHPVSALVSSVGCDPSFVDLLQRLGLTRLADVAALSAVDLVDRFGELGAWVHRLATGTDDTAPATAPPPDDLSATHEFDDPVPLLDPLVFAAKSLADRIDTHLADRGLVGTRVVVEAESDHGEVSRRVWYRVEGLRAAAIVDRVRWQLDGWINGADPPSAGIIALRITPTDVRHDSGHQQGFWGERSRADHDAAKAATRLAGLLGPDAVCVASWRGGRDPHRVYDLVPITRIGADGTDVTVRPDTVPPWPGAVPTPLPAVVHHEPVAIDLLDAAGRRVSVTGRGVPSAEPAELHHRGRRWRVVAWAGPWPLEERWWDARHRRAARFQLVVDATPGERAYLAEISAGHWWLTAEYG